MYVLYIKEKERQQRETETEKSGKREMQGKRNIVRESETKK